MRRVLIICKKVVQIKRHLTLDEQNVYIKGKLGSCGAATALASEKKT